MISTDSEEPLRDLPPIILLVDEHRDGLELYSRCLEDAGLWVATTMVSAETVATAEELKPDLVVADTDGDSDAVGDAIVALKHHASLRLVPIIAITADASRGAEADSVLVKPVEPHQLLRRTKELLAHCSRLRATVHDVRERAASMRIKAASALERSAEISARARARVRRCPVCNGALEWIEETSVGGIGYDNYRRCLSGCGLFCYDRTHAIWVRLG